MNSSTYITNTEHMPAMLPGNIHTAQTPVHTGLLARREHRNATYRRRPDFLSAERSDGRSGPSQPLPVACGTPASSRFVRQPAPWGPDCTRIPSRAPRGAADSQTWQPGRTVLKPGQGGTDDAGRHDQSHKRACRVSRTAPRRQKSLSAAVESAGDAAGSHGVPFIGR